MYRVGSDDAIAEHVPLPERCDGSPYEGVDLRTLTLALLLSFASTAPASGGSESSGPSFTAVQIFSKARALLRNRSDLPFVTCAIRQRYRMGARSWDDWWQANYRNSDRRFVLRRIVDEEVDRQRLRGIALTSQFFGVHLFDTNSHAEAIVAQDPTIPMVATFDSAPADQATLDDNVASSDDGLRTIGQVEAASGDYHVEILEPVADSADAASYHLRLTPLRDPDSHRLRDLWVDKATLQTRKLIVSGIYHGEPYDKTPFTVTFVDFGGRSYVQQIKSGAPLRFGLTVIDELELDYVDYHFPDTIPAYVFAKM